MTDNAFPSDFTWGAATSAFQIEGALNMDGRGESIWDCFCRQPGAIADGSTAEIACDHYRRMPEDVALMKHLGLNAYRFSIAWPRIFPEGRGRTESRGLDFYDRLVDQLLESGITPYVTLHHWDLPQALQNRGGWTNRECISDFCAYADVVTGKLGDRVKHWITMNEPWCMAMLGYWQGEHAPGRRDPSAALTVAHHLLVAHGRAVPILRANSAGCKIGLALNLTPAYPASPGPADQRAAQSFDGRFNRWFLDPVYRRTYPEDIVSEYRQSGYLPADGMPFVREDDMKTIAEPIDFLGVNYYTRSVCQDASSMSPGQVVTGQQTEMGWEIYPAGLYDLLVRLHREYRVPRIHITENGCSYSDGPDRHGIISDTRRVEYHEQHLAQAYRAWNEGVPLSGYFAWSLMDNFEWQFGYRQRFGMIWIDYTTGRRRLKTSAEWYRKWIAASLCQTPETTR